MPMPIVGIGHSLGANMLCNLALIHPRLLTTVVFLDPVIQKQATSSPNPVQASTFRRDLWPSREEAEASFRKQAFYQSWDPRVLDRWCKYGLRDTPTSLYPDKQGAVTLSTTKHQECFTFLRPSWEAMNADGSEILNRDLVPDLSMKSPTRFPFYRAEPPNTLDRLDQLRPTVLYIFGAESPMSTPEARQLKMQLTGTGLGGSGGAKDGKVKEVVLDGIGHLVAMEASERCADATAAWLGQELKRFNVEKQEYLEWTKKSLSEKQTLTKEWEKRIGGKPVRPTTSKI